MLDSYGKQKNAKARAPTDSLFPSIVAARSAPPSTSIEQGSTMSDTPIQVLLVDDDADLRDLLRTFFQQRGIEISVLHDAESSGAPAPTRAALHFLVVLDLMMPGIDGLSALRQLRALKRQDDSVIMPTARAEGVDRVIGLELGADDYLQRKPFMPQELLARIHAVLRRHAQPAASATPPVEKREALRFGSFRLDFASRTLYRGDEPLELTGSEYALLEVLAQLPMQRLSCRARGSWTCCMGRTRT